MGQVKAAAFMVHPSPGHMTSAWPIRNLPRTFLPRISEDESLCFTGQDVVSMVLEAAGTMVPKCRESPFQKQQVTPMNRKDHSRQKSLSGSFMLLKKGSGIIIIHLVIMLLVIKCSKYSISLLFSLLLHYFSSDFFVLCIMRPCY